MNIYYPYFKELADVFEGAYTSRRFLYLCGFIILAFSLIVNCSWKATPDSALYLELGESIASGKGYLYNEAPHTYVPPGFPLILSCWVGTFGSDYFSYRALMSLIGVVSAFAGLSLIWRLCGPQLGIVIGGIFSINHTIVLNSTYTSSDVPFTLACLLSFHLILSVAQHKDSIIILAVAGFVAGAPALIRINGWGLPPALVIFLWSGYVHSNKTFKITRCLLFLALAFSLPISWECYKSYFPVSPYEGEYLRAVMGRSLENQIMVILGSTWEYLFETAYALTGISMRTGVIEFALCFCVILGLVEAYRKGERLFSVFLVIQMSGLILSSAGSRYMAPLIPGLYLFLGLGVLKLVGTWNLYLFKLKIHSSKITIFLFVIMAVTNLGADIQTIYQARTALQSQGPESSRDAPFFAAAKWIKSDDPQGPILSMNPRILRYLTGVRTIDLLKSGVPEHLAWASTEQEISTILEYHEPKYLFADSKNAPLQNVVFDTIKKNGRKLVEMKEAKVGDRFSLWKITAPGN